VFAATYGTALVRRLHDGGAWRHGATAYADRVAPVVRDILGNPLRPAALDPEWLTADVRGLAAAAYEDRAFDRLPILADALADARCADEAMLGHCRDGSPHVRDCWVVDLILSKDR
jgi:hypothetical protein